MLSLDISVIFISALLWFLMVVLNKIFFKPVGQAIENRESQVEKKQIQIKSMTKEIEEKAQHIEQILIEAKKESSGIINELIKKGEEVREQFVADARGKSKKHFETKKKQLDEEITVAGKKLEQEIAVFSEKIKEIFI